MQTRIFFWTLVVLLLAAAAACREAPKTANKPKTAADPFAEFRDVPMFVRAPSGTEYDKMPQDFIFCQLDDARQELGTRKAGMTKSQVRVEIPRKSDRKGSKKPRVRVITKQEPNTLLAVLDIKSQPKIMKFIWLDPQGQPTPRDFTIKVGPPRGIGTSYEVVKPTHHVVLAVKRALKLNGRYEEVIYTPYTSTLDVPAVRHAGYDYLLDQIRTAAYDLRLREIRSLAFPDKLVANVVPRQLALTLSIIEHIDPDEFEALAGKLAKEKNLPANIAEREAIKILGKCVLVVTGANRENSFKFAVSPAGARGLFQFMPRTYQNLRECYPRTGLVKSFQAGMANHTNAAKASLLLFDSDLSFGLPEYRQFLADHPEALGMYLAAAYNGGVKRTIKAIKDRGERWTLNVLPETRVYIRKFLALQSAFAEN